MNINTSMGVFLTMYLIALFLDWLDKIVDFFQNLF